MFRGTLAAALLAELLFGTAGRAAQSAGSLVDRLRANASPFGITDGRLSEGGAQFLESATDGVQFVALGEEHNTRALPALTTALFRLLHERHGFEYLALEEGPHLGRLLSRAVRSGGPDAVLALGRRHPNAFHMYTEGELQMIGDIGRISMAAEPIWGLNQEFGALHVYQRLVEIAPDARARMVASKFLDQARAYEGERFQKNVHYMVAIARPEDFARLREVFQPKAGSEAERLIEQTALSNRIYAPYGATPAPSAEAFHESGRTRETNMKDLFAKLYRQAEARGKSAPKVLIKSGHVHLYRGLSPRSELFTLGNFLSEFAILNGRKSFHLYAIVDRPYVREGWLAPFAEAALAGEATVFDLRPLFVWARRNDVLDPNVRRLILAHDALVFLRDGAPGSLEKLRTPNFRWYPDN